MSVECKVVGTEFMAKRLLIMALVAVQCASWSGASLFLCLGADGSVCIDRGPESCTSCHEEEAGHACCDLHDACCEEHAHDASALNVPLLAGDPCDCTHVQISQTQAPTVVAGQATKSGLERAALIPDVCHTACDCSAAKTLLPRGGPPPGPTLVLMTVNVAVRTC